MNVCILASGVGSRNTKFPDLHKALYPYRGKAFISHIIENCYDYEEIVIAVHHLADQIKAYIKYVHPEKNIRFVDVGETAGPGESLFKCREFLGESFWFTACDALSNRAYDKHTSCSVAYNVILVNTITHNEEVHYVEGNHIYRGRRPFGVGFFGAVYVAANHRDEFFKYLANHTEVAEVFNDLDKSRNIFGEVYDSIDIGSDARYDIHSPTKILDKITDTITFFDNGKVVKFNPKTSEFIGRVFKFIPETDWIHSDMYGYRYIPGETLSSVKDESVHQKFFDEYLSRFYLTGDDVRLQCGEMYFAKTLRRSLSLIDSDLDKIGNINGVIVPSLAQILAKIDWNYINESSLAIKFHGDPQPENIIWDGKDFHFIDCRDSFHDNKVYGDLYYDLSKLYHGILLNNRITEEQSFEIAYKDNEVSFVVHTDSNLLSLKEKFEDFVEKNNLDLDHIKLLTYLHYINISQLYKSKPYSDLLFLYGKLGLTKCLQSKV